MAPDNKTPVWGSGLNTQVDGKTLQFDPSAATTGMNAAGDLLRAMRGYKSAVDQLGLNHLPPISFLPSGKALAEGLSRRGTELQTAFDTHIDILTAMVETFRAAGQAYKNTDGLSAEQLDKATSSINKLGDYKIPDGEISAGFKTEPYRIGLLEQLPDHDFPGDLKKYRDTHKDAKDAGNFLDNVYIKWESGQNQQWEDLIRLHNELNGDPYYLAGQDWKTLADKVNTSIGDFGTKIEGLSNSWHGAGASGAREAVRRYARDAQPMLDTMKLMSELLDFTGRWVTWTKGCMPAHKEDKACTDDLGNYRRYFDRDYVGNGKDTQSVMPIMPQPTVDKPEPVKPPEKPDTPEKPKPKDGDDGKGGGKADTGGGGGGGGGKSDAGGGGNQKAAQDAKDAADKKAAQDAKDAADSKAAQDAKDAADRKAAQDAKDAADSKAAQDAKDAAAKKAAEDAKNAQNGAGSNNGSGPGGVPSTGGTTSPASNSSSSGQGLSQLSSLLTSLAQAGTTAAQSLPSLLTAIDSALNTGDNAKLAQLLGVPEDKITAAMSQIQNQPDKLAELSQLLGLTNGTTAEPVVPAAGLPGEVAPSGAAVVTPAAAAVTTTPAGGLTNLFPRAGLDLGATQPVFGVTADLSDNPMVSGVSAGADHEPPPVDFLGVLAQVGEPREVNPVVET